MINNLIALLAEGAAEEAILNVLIDTNKLKYNRVNLLREKVIRTRSAKTFQVRYMSQGLTKKLKIYRVHDSKTERFKLSKAYLRNVDEIVEVYTTPEIEILFIIYHGDYAKYVKRSKSKLKTSEYVKRHYADLDNIKSYHDVYNFWISRSEALVETIREYTRTSSDDFENTLAGLLK